MAVLDVGQGTEAVELDLEEEVGVVEGSGDLEEVHGGEFGEGTHGSRASGGHSPTVGAANRYLYFDDVCFRTLYEFDYIVTFSLRDSKSIQSGIQVQQQR